MKNRKYIPKEIKGGRVECFKCVHEHKCIKGMFVTVDCGSFQKRAGIKKKIKKRNKGE